MGESTVGGQFDIAGIAQLGEQQTEAFRAFWRSRVQSTLLAFFETLITPFLLK